MTTVSFFFALRHFVCTSPLNDSLAYTSDAVGFSRLMRSETKAEEGYLDEADPFAREQLDSLEGDGAYARSRHPEHVEVRPGVGLVSVGQRVV